MQMMQPGLVSPQQLSGRQTAPAVTLHTLRGGRVCPHISAQCVSLCMFQQRRDSDSVTISCCWATSSSSPNNLSLHLHQPRPTKPAPPLRWWLLHSLSESTSVSSPSCVSSPSWHRYQLWFELLLLRWSWRQDPRSAALPDQLPALLWSAPHQVELPSSPVHPTVHPTSVDVDEMDANLVQEQRLIA